MNKRKLRDTWCFCCGIWALFFIFIGLIIIHVDLTETEEEKKPLSDKAEFSFPQKPKLFMPSLHKEWWLAADLGSRRGFSISSD